MWLNRIRIFRFGEIKQVRLLLYKKKYTAKLKLSIVLNNIIYITAQNRWNSTEFWYYYIVIYQYKLIFVKRWSFVFFYLLEPMRRTEKGQN